MIDTSPAETTTSSPSRSPSRAPSSSLTWATGFALILVALHLLPPEWHRALWYDRALVGSGEWWRLLTGNLVHVGWTHLALDVGALVIGIFVFYEARTPVAWTVALVVCGLATNIGLYFGMKGRVIPACSACTSGSQSIGYSYEAIRFGRATLMAAGGAEELCASEAAVFDTLYATSTRNDTPATTPRPFDRARDGLVIGEGAATLVLEEREHALARGARILGEIVGFGCNSDGTHVTQPESATMAQAMRLALDDAGLPAQAIDYVSAHGTATDRGDIAESQATAEVLGHRVPISPGRAAPCRVPARGARTLASGRRSRSARRRRRAPRAA